MAKFINDDSQSNPIAIKYGSKWFSKAKSTARQLRIRGTGDFYRKLKDRYRYDEGEINRISIQTTRTGILQEKGVGRGVGMKNGVRFDKSKNRAALIRRKMKPWLSLTVTDQEITNLADDLARVKADVFVRAINF